MNNNVKIKTVISNFTLIILSLKQGIACFQLCEGGEYINQSQHNHGAGVEFCYV